jgi:TetR/AcrR family transcriptional repressor of nem operon
MARPRTFDEDTVLGAARSQFGATGYAGTSVDDILSATGLGKGSLYGAFGSKHDLFVRVFDDYCAESISGVRRDLEGSPTGAFDRLRSHLLGYAAAVGTGRDYAGCLLAKGTAELATDDEVVGARALQTFDEYERLLARCIENAQREGEIDEDADPVRLAALLLALLRGMEALGKAGRDEGALRLIAEAGLELLPRAKKRASQPAPRSSAQT